MSKIYQKKLSVINNDKSATNGFTLIELLVVVLIIGVLAAIALPKYQKAVDRSRWMGWMQTERNISKAQEVFFVVNGYYTDNFLDLGLSYPGAGDKGFTQGQMQVHFYGERGTPYLQISRRKDNTSYEDIFLLTFYYSFPKRVQRQCRPATGTPNANWKDLCLYLFGEKATVQGNGWVILEE